VEAAIFVIDGARKPYIEYVFVQGAVHLRGQLEIGLARGLRKRRWRLLCNAYAGREKQREEKRTEAQGKTPFEPSARVSC
jgi:hypothetical protein